MTSPSRPTTLPENVRTCGSARTQPSAASTAAAAAALRIQVRAFAICLCKLLVCIEFAQSVTTPSSIAHLRRRGQPTDPRPSSDTSARAACSTPGGATMRAAAQAVRPHHPARLVVAVPTAAVETCEELCVDRLTVRGETWCPANLGTAPARLVCVFDRLLSIPGEPTISNLGRMMSHGTSHNLV